MAGYTYNIILYAKLAVFVIFETESKALKEIKALKATESNLHI